MADCSKTFRVNVKTSAPGNINVTPGQVQNAITATGDTALYYATLAKNWAISPNLIMDEDYSSKHYAGISKEQAEISQESATTAAQLLTQINTTATEIDNTLKETLNSALSDIDEAENDVLTNIDTIKTTTINTINSTVETAESDIETAKTNAVNTMNTTSQNTISAVQTASDEAQDDIEEAVSSAKSEVETKITEAQTGLDGYISTSITEAQSDINEITTGAVANIEAVADEQYVDGVTFHQDADVVDLEIVNPTPNWGDIQGTLSNQTDLQNALESKVDKVEGKSLISDSEISRLAGVTNYDDTEIKADIAQAEADIDNLETNKQDKLTAGEGISIVGDIISCTVKGGGGSGDVTAAGDNTFTGENTFSGNVFFAGADKLRVSNAGATQYNTVANFVEDNSLLDTDIDSALLNYMSIGSTSLDNVFLQTPFVKAYNSEQGKDIANTMFHSGNLLAGNNITIERDGAKFKINAAGGGGSSTVPDPLTAGIIFTGAVSGNPVQESNIQAGTGELVIDANRIYFSDYTMAENLEEAAIYGVLSGEAGMFWATDPTKTTEEDGFLSSRGIYWTHSNTLLSPADSGVYVLSYETMEGQTQPEPNLDPVLTNKTLQQTEFDSLNTTDKTVIGAINELKSSGGGTGGDITSPLKVGQVTTSGLSAYDENILLGEPEYNGGLIFGGAEFCFCDPKHTGGTDLGIIANFRGDEIVFLIKDDNGTTEEIKQSFQELVYTLNKEAPEDSGLYNYSYNSTTLDPFLTKNTLPNTEFSGLNTDAKKIIDAINELKTRLDNLGA